MKRLIAALGIVLSGCGKREPGKLTPHYADETIAEARRVWELNDKNGAKDAIGACLVAKITCSGERATIYGLLNVPAVFPLFFNAEPGERTGEAITLPGDLLALDGNEPPDWNAILEMAGDRPPHTVVLKPEIEKAHTPRTKYLVHSSVYQLAAEWKLMRDLGAVVKPQKRKRAEAPIPQHIVWSHRLYWKAVGEAALYWSIILSFVALIWILVRRKARPKYIKASIIGLVTAIFGPPAWQYFQFENIDARPPEEALIALLLLFIFLVMVVIVTVGELQSWATRANARQLMFGFAKGERLRLTIEYWTVVLSSGYCIWWWFHDPSWPPVAVAVGVFAFVVLLHQEPQVVISVADAHEATTDEIREAGLIEERGL